MSGGARLRSGPAGDPNALRGNKGRADWEHLPASGYTGPVPEWPLTRSTARERKLWARLWARPQAIMWDRLRVFEEVALHVRTLALAERRFSPVDARRLAQQQANSLGLTASGLAAFRWVIDLEPSAPVQRTEPGDVVDIRSRMRDAGGAS